MENDAVEKFLDRDQMTWRFAGDVYDRISILMTKPYAESMREVQENSFFHPRKQFCNPEALGKFLVEYSTLLFLSLGFLKSYLPFDKKEEDWHDFYHLLHCSLFHKDSEDVDNYLTGECDDPKNCHAYGLTVRWFMNYQEICEPLWREAETRKNVLILMLSMSGVDFESRQEKDATERAVQSCLASPVGKARLRSFEKYFESKQNDLESEIVERLIEFGAKSYDGLSFREAVLKTLNRDFNFPLLVGRSLKNELDRLDRMSVKERECPACYKKTEDKDQKKCPECGTELSGVESIINISLEDKLGSEREGYGRTIGETIADDRPYEATILTTAHRKEIERYGGKHAPRIVDCIIQGPPDMTQVQISLHTGLSLSTVEKTLKKMLHPDCRTLLSEI